MPNQRLIRPSDMFTMTGFDDVLRSNLVYNRQDLDWYSKFNRFGFMDPYNNLSQSKEYLFFTKPDCHIFTPNTMNLQPVLANNTFFIEMANRYPHVLQQLQSSCGTMGGDDAIVKNPFMVLLSNSIKNTVDLQALSATEMDNSTNQYGTTLPYRKDAWTGDENVEFGLEFEDSRFLEVYLLLKSYEEYERLKTIGMIYPPNIDGVSEHGEARHNFNKYIREKRLHDVFGIYRFIVGEDYQTIIYYAYICGAYFNSVPRDAFNDLKNGEGLTFSADFKAFCVLDMDPIILMNFNRLIYNAYGTDSPNRAQLPIYGTNGYIPSDEGMKNDFIRAESNARINGSWAEYPLVARIKQDSVSTNAWVSSKDMAYQYQLQWFGNSGA